MEYRTECFSTVAHLLGLPDAAFVAQLALATDPAIMPAEVAGQVALFEERVAELSLGERQELFAETFADSAAAEDRRCLAACLRCAADSPIPAPVAASLDRLTNTLLRARNPYHHLLVAARTLLEWG